MATVPLSPLVAQETPDPAQRVHAAVIEEVFQLVQQARQELSFNRFESAIALLNKALTLDPRNQAVVAELQRAKQLAGDAPVQATPEKALNLEAQLAEVEVRVALQRAELQMAAGQFERATNTLDTARVLLERFPNPGQTEFLERIEGPLQRSTVAAIEQEQTALRAQRDEAQRQAILLSDINHAAKRSQFQIRFERIIAIKQRGHLELALAETRQLVSDYPQQAEAETLFQALLTAVHEKRDLDIAEAKQYRTQEIFERIHRVMVPEGFDGRPIFPGDWRERDQRSASGIEEVVELDPWQEQLMDKLSQRLDVDFEDIDLVEALEFVAKRGSVNLIIDADVRAGAYPPVTLRASNIRIDNLLNWLTRTADTRWKLRNEAVFVGDDDTDETILRVYDVTAVLSAAPEMPGPGVSMFSLGGSGGAGGGGGGFDLFGGGGDDGDLGIAPEDLIDLIQTAVSPESWDNPDYGIDIRNDSYLVITAPSSLHVLIREFLRTQANVNKTLVHVNLRWLEINDNYLEEIGVDWRNLPSDLLSAGPGGIGTGGAFTQGATASALGRVINNLPETAMDIAPSLVNSGLQLQLAYMGIQQLSAVLRAVERKDKGRVVNGAEITCMNGQRAHAMFTRQVAYISDYNIETGDGAGNYDPVISVYNTGTIIDVKPLVSADRKYVTLDVRPILTTATIFVENISVITTVANGPVVLSYPIELPNLRIQTAAARVMIPDGGSIVVGGFKESIEQTSQSTVPVIGHLPYIGRLFGVRGRYSQRNRLYLTATVDIILYQEEEAYL